ncbi:putative peroxiredoxin bcp [Abditibacteriota bacterium]|nr:putative peroxiredoxin bcp [Abditibacteriota bacterium]
MPHDFKEGEPFPGFELPSVALWNGEKNEHTVSNETLLGRPFVLWVYPKDQTSGCTIEAREFSQLYLQLQDAGVEVLGLSRDSIRSHVNFLRAQELPFALLSDAGGAWMNSHGLIYEAKMYGKPVTKVARTTFLVDGDGTVRRIWENVTPAGHGAQVLEAVTQLK